MILLKQKKELAGLSLALGLITSMAPQAEAAIISNATQYVFPSATVVAPFGEGALTYNTIGQTFTAPDIDNILNSFTFNVRHLSPAPTKFAAYVYAWDEVGQKATGSQLFASDPMIATKFASTPFQVNTGNLALTSSNKYVAFFNNSSFYDGIFDINAVDLVTNSTYTGGKVVFGRTGTNLSGVTETQLNSFGNLPYDLRFTANFSAPAPTTAAVPEPGTMSLMGLGLAALGAARRKKRAAQSEAEETGKI